MVPDTKKITGESLPKNEDKIQKFEIEVFLEAFHCLK